MPRSYLPNTLCNTNRLLFILAIQMSLLLPLLPILLPPLFFTTSVVAMSHTPTKVSSL